MNGTGEPDLANGPDTLGSPVPAPAQVAGASTKGADRPLASVAALPELPRSGGTQGKNKRLVGTSTNRHVERSTSHYVGKSPGLLSHFPISTLTDKFPNLLIDNQG